MTTDDTLPAYEETARPHSSSADNESDQLIAISEDVHAAAAEPGATPAEAEPTPEMPPPDPRRDWAERIRNEQRLPGSLRQRLAATVEDAADLNDGEEPRLTVSQIATVFAEAIPSLLGVESSLASAAHPGGDAFFQPSGLSDDDAARLARQQLQRTGFYRQS